MAPLSAPGTERARAVLAGVILVGLMCVPFVALRLWARRLSKARLVLNDYLILAAMFIFLGQTSNSVYVVIKAGIGQHRSQVTSSELRHSLDLPPTVLYLVTTCLIRLSVLHFYLTIFAPIRETRWASQILLVLSAGFGIAAVLATIFFCSPVSASYFSENPNVHCGDARNFFFTMAIISVILDVAIVITPQRCIWNLHMRRGRKLSLAIIFGIGAIISMFSILRVYAITQIDPTDESYTVVFDVFMTELEPALGIVNACLPILMPVIRLASRKRCLSFLNHLVPESYASDFHEMQDEQSVERRCDSTARSGSRSVGTPGVIHVAREIDITLEYEERTSDGSGRTHVVSDKGSTGPFHKEHDYRGAVS